MMWLFDKLLSWVGGGIIGQIAAPLNEAYKNRLAAQNETERLVADAVVEDVKAQMAARQAQKEIRLATAGFWEMRLLTFLIAIPFAEHLLAVWMDTRWGIYSSGGMFEHCWISGGIERCGVPAFPAPFDEWEGAILLSFFGLQASISGINAIAAAIRGRR